MNQQYRIESQTIQVSLLCFLHSITVFSLGLFIINDHLLKWIYPSWITGKLSDFTGVFFFPFLIAFLLGLTGNVSPRRAGLLAVLLTGGGFAVLQFPAWYAPFARICSPSVFDVSLMLTPDPTDLLALVMLYPSFHMWNTACVSPDHQQVRARAYILVCLSAFASMATSPRRYEGVIGFERVDTQVYAITAQFPGPRGLGLQKYRMNETENTWEYVGEVSPRDPFTFLDTPILTDPHVANRQYRGIRPGILEYSTDAGASWQVLWKIPAGRLFLLQRLPSYFWQRSGVGPYTLTFGGTHHDIFLVAMGTEGILVRDASGTWKRQAVGQATPSFFWGVPVTTLVMLLVAWSTIVMLGLYHLFSWIAWMVILRNLHHGVEFQKRQRVLVPYMLKFGISSTGFIILYLSSFGSRAQEWWFAFRILYTILLYPFFTLWLLHEGWHRIIRISANIFPAKNMQTICSTFMLWGVMGLTCPLAGWIVGIIPWFWLAAGTSLVFASILCVQGSQYLVRACKKVHRNGSKT